MSDRELRIKTVELVISALDACKSSTLGKELGSFIVRTAKTIENYIIAGQVDPPASE